MKDKLSNLLGSVFPNRKPSKETPACEEVPGAIERPFVGKVFRGYRIVEYLDEGAQGSVYRVRPEDGRNLDFALKFNFRPAAGLQEELNDPNLPERQRKDLQHRLELALSADKRFEREMRTLSEKLEHPNVVKPIDFGTEEKRHWVIMPYLGKVSLATRLDQARMEVSEILSVFEDITKGLQAVHSQGIAHRDLKPQNIMLWEGKAVIIDFGLVKGGDDKTFTAPGTVLGTTDYVAPEQVNFQEPQNEKTDQFALGAMLFFTLTGTFPYPCKGLHSLMMRGQVEYESLSKYRPDLKAEVGDVLKKMMAKLQGERYADVTEAFESLRAAFQ